MVFYKLVGTVAEDARVFELYPLPPLVSNLCAVLFAFCGGVVTASFLLMCFAQTPAAAGIKGIDRSALRASSVGVMRIMARSVNAFSFQSMSSAAEETLSGLEKDPPPVPEETLEEKVKAKKAARKTVKKMRILENGVAVPVEEEKTPTETGDSRTDSPEQTPRSNDTSSDVTAELPASGPELPPIPPRPPKTGTCPEKNGTEEPLRNVGTIFRKHNGVRSRNFQSGRCPQTG